MFPYSLSHPFGQGLCIAVHSCDCVVHCTHCLLQLIASYNSCEYTNPTLLQGLVDASRELQVLRGAPVRPSEHSTGVQSQDWQPLPTVAWHTISTAYQIIMTTKLNSLSTDEGLHFR